MKAKQEEMKQLWKELALNKKVTQSYKNRKGKKVNIGFINQFSLHNSIPNKWFDWENRVNVKILIIGQDWGPYSALLPYITKYEALKDQEDYNYDNYLFETFSSRTEKFIIKVVEKSYFEKFNKQITQEVWNNFFFTVAIMFTRQGNHFRGNEFFDEKLGIEESLPYLKKQIEIVKPKVIMPLGGIAWRMVNDIFNLKRNVTISQVIDEQRAMPICIDDVRIIPNFHPASHTNPEIQYNIWKTIWENISNK